MYAKITGENEDNTGLHVIDNNEAKHRIEMHKDGGEIYAHQCDAYADDPYERTPTENEHNEQARRYAQYYVAAERGYDTIEWRYDPDRLVTTALTVAELEPDAVAEYFGDLYDQVRSHATDVDRPVSLPDGVRPGHVNYQQDVYLGLADGVLAQLTALGDDLNLPAVPGDTIEDRVATLLAEAPADADVPDASDLAIETVSGVHVRWDDAAGQYHHERHGQPDLDRDPDARFDIFPFTPADIEAFQAQLVRNLLCQVRDSYVGMGVAPPEPFRIKGLGRHQIATLYEQFDVYQRYHDPAADIDWDALDAAAATIE